MGSLGGGGAASLGGSAGTSQGGTAQGGGNAGGKASGGASAGGGTSTSGGKAGGGTTAAGGSASGGKASGGTSSGGASGGAGGTSAHGGTTSSGGSGAGGSSHTGVWNVMPLGDSITAATCYPQVLSQLFKSGGHTNFKFVGTQTTNQSCGANAPSVTTEGHSGYGVTYLPQNSTRSACTKTTGCGSFAELQTWAAEKPDIVLMHLGTNDIWDGQSVASILSAYLAVIAEFRKQNPNVIFFVSKIIKLSPSGCTACLTNVAALAAALTDTWASTNSTATSPVYTVDDYDSGFDPTSTADTADGVHPTLAGAMKVANATYTGVIARGYF